MSVYFSLDRIEGGVAVLYDDDGKRVETATDNLVGSKIEGSCYKQSGGMFVYDEEHTEHRRQYARKLQQELFLTDNETS